MSIPIKEQETVINFSREDKRMSIYTSDTTMITKLEKCVHTEGSEWTLDEIIKDKNGEEVARCYSCPKKCISYRAKRITRILTEEERQTLSERLKKIQQVNKQRKSEINE